MLKFFKKEVPKTPVYLPNGDKLTFETLDGVYGYHKTERPDEIEALQKLEREHRGGVFAITQEEYERDFGKKKQGLNPSVPASPPHQWREEVGTGVAPDTLGQRIVAPAPAAVPAPASNPPTPPTPAEPPKRTVRPPNVGRRIA